MSYTVMGINSGLGVSLYPFKDQLIANVEIRGIFHTPKNEQWKMNFGEIPLFKKFDPKYDGELRKILKQEPDVIISSPDCGSGSVFRFSRAKKLGNHKDNQSLILFLKAIVDYTPKFFLFENLDGLFKSFPEKDFRAILHEYRLVIHNASVAHWGNSQKTRKRLVIVGIRKDLGKGFKKYFKLPEIPPLKTCGKLYLDLAFKHSLSGNVREPIDEIISIHARKRMSLKEIQDEWLGRLKGEKRWKVEGGTFSTAPGVYRNMDDDYPSTARKANRQYDERGLTLTPRHLGRIQGVPDSFGIYIDPLKEKYWINKGRTVCTKTPPMEISIWFKKQLDKAYRKNYPI